MKFDVIVGNPPYLQGLHMKILQKGFQLLEDDGHLIFVHPSTCFINKKGGNFPGKSIVDEISDHVQSLEFINGNKIFNAGLFIPCSITLISKEKRTKDVTVKYVSGEEVSYESLYDVSKFPEKDVVKSLTSKLSGCDNLEQHHFDAEKPNFNDIREFGVGLACIRGHVTQTDDLILPDFYTMLSKNNLDILSCNEIRQRLIDKKMSNNLFTFETVNECENFIKYVKTNFARRALSLLKNNGNVHRGELALIPYLDFNQEWNDEKLATEFKLSAAEIDFVNAIPKYYN